MVGRTGFEPVKAMPADLQSAPFDRFGTYPHGEETPTLAESILGSTKIFENHRIFLKPLKTGHLWSSSVILWWG